MAQLFKSQEGGILSLFNMFLRWCCQGLQCLLGHHALYFSIHHHAIGAYVIPALEQLKKGQTGRENHAIYTVWNRWIGFLPVAGYCSGIRRYTSGLVLSPGFNFS